MFRFQGNKGMPLVDLLEGVFFGGRVVAETRKEKLDRIFLFLALGLRKLYFVGTHRMKCYPRLLCFCLI